MQHEQKEAYKDEDQKSALYMKKDSKKQKQKRKKQSEELFSTLCIKRHLSATIENIFSESAAIGTSLAY